VESRKLTPNYRLIQGDAFEVLNKLYNEKNVTVDGCFTSPNPYHFTNDERQVGGERSPEVYIKSIMRILNGVSALMRSKGSIWIHLSDLINPSTGSFYQIPERFAIAMEDTAGWRIRSKLIWWREWNSSLKKQSDKNRLAVDWDPIYHLTDKFTHSTFNHEYDHLAGSSIRRIFFRTQRPGIWESGLPQTLIEGCLRLTVKAGDTVIDPFMGTGTTGLVAMKMGCNFIGIDIEKEVVILTGKRFGLK
jgi:DNA modification methylase